MAINFTKEHYAKLKELAFDMLVSNDTIPTKLGQSLTILELMHTTTINTTIRLLILSSRIIRAMTAETIIN